MAKKRPTYTADQLRELKGRMVAKSHELVERAESLVTDLSDNTTFDSACELRDVAQQLVSATHALGDIDQFIELAKLRNTPQAVSFDLESMGL